MRGRVALVSALLVVAGCSAAPDLEDAPEGFTAEVMQYRGKRLTRDIAIAIRNDTNREITLSAMRLESNRWSEAVDWSGTESVGPGFGTGIDVDPPGGTCPEGEVLATVAEFTYRTGDDDRRSRVDVEDPYGVLQDLVDGDCGEQAFDAATSVTVGSPEVRGDTWSATLDLAPREPNDVVLLGFAPTLRFAFGPATPVDVELPLDQPQRVRLDVVMGRCDPHVVAEDKVGSRFGVRVRTTDIEHAYFTLPLDDAVRESLEEFYAERCRP